MYLVKYLKKLQKLQVKALGSGLLIHITNRFTGGHSWLVVDITSEDEELDLWETTYFYSGPMWKEEDCAQKYERIEAFVLSYIKEKK